MAYARGEICFAFAALQFVMSCDWVFRNPINWKYSDQPDAVPELPLCSAQQRKYQPINQFIYVASCSRITETVI